MRRPTSTARRGSQRFRYVTFPMMRNLYLVCTVLSTIWSLGDFNTVHFITGGGPALSTHVLATLGIRDAFELGDPPLGMATVISALPLLIPLVILLMRKLRQERGRSYERAAAPRGRTPRRPNRSARSLLGVRHPRLDAAADLQHDRCLAQAKEDVLQQQRLPAAAELA